MCKREISAHLFLTSSIKECIVISSFLRFHTFWESQIAKNMFIRNVYLSLCMRVSPLYHKKRMKLYSYYYLLHEQNTFSVQEIIRQNTVSVQHLVIFRQNFIKFYPYAQWLSSTFWEYWQGSELSRNEFFSY